MFWVLKRTVSLRRFFWVPTTYVLVEKQENKSSLHTLNQSLVLALIFFILDTRKRVLWQTVKTQMKCCLNGIFIAHLVCSLSRVCTALKSTWIYRTLEKSLKIKLPWKVLEKHSKTLNSPWILPFTGVLNTVFGDLNQYKIAVSLFGAAYAAPNKGTTIL